MNTALFVALFPGGASPAGDVPPPFVAGNKLTFTARDPGRHYQARDPGRHFKGEGAVSYLPQSYEKRTAWKRLYDWDFSPFDEFTLAPAETGIATASAVLTAGDGQLVLGAPAISGTLVQILVSGGTPGVAYTITVTITTRPGAYVLNLDGIVNVLA